MPVAVRMSVADKHTLRINSRQHGAGLSISVRLLHPHTTTADNHQPHVITVLGYRVRLSPTVSDYHRMPTATAEEILRRVAPAIAEDYLTDTRVSAFLLQTAIGLRDRRRTELDKLIVSQHQALAVSIGELQAAERRVVDADAVHRAAHTPPQQHS